MGEIIEIKPETVKFAEPRKSKNELNNMLSIRQQINTNCPLIFVD